MAELCEGFSGDLANDEVSFMVLDGAMIMIACSAFTFLHPGFGFTRAGWEASTFQFFNKSEKDIERDAKREAKRQAIIAAAEEKASRRAGGALAA